MLHSDKVSILWFDSDKWGFKSLFGLLSGILLSFSLRSFLFISVLNSSTIKSVFISSGFLLRLISDIVF